MTYMAVFSRRFVWAWWPTFALIQYSFIPSSSLLLHRLYWESEHWMSENESLSSGGSMELTLSNIHSINLRCSHEGHRKDIYFTLLTSNERSDVYLRASGALLPWEIHESRVYTIHNRTLIMNRANTLDWRLYLAFSLSMNLCFQWWKAERWHYKCFLNG